MPYPFVLPTTSFVDFSLFYRSNTHPCLPVAATTARIRLRDALKNHKRTSAINQNASLLHVLDTLSAYLPYLFALDVGLGGGCVSDDEIDVILLKDVRMQWRPTLTESSVGREPSRVNMTSLEADLSFVLLTLAYVQTLLAREALWPIYQPGAAPLQVETRAQIIAKAMRHLLDASSVNKCLHARVTRGEALQNAPVDTTPIAAEALASLALAEATLIAVLKDDPYPVAITDDRNNVSKDWMYKAPDLGIKRLNLLVRICVGAADHASQAAAILRNAPNLDQDIVAYATDLCSTARAKAARFQAISLDSESKTGEAIAWLCAAKKHLGLDSKQDGKVTGLSKLKRGWQERIEDQRTRRGGHAWGADGGKAEEIRVLEMLHTKWTKMNDTYIMQAIPPYHFLLSTLPSGREYHKPTTWKPPMLQEAILAQMRAPLIPNETLSFATYDDDDSDDELQRANLPPGAFPAAGSECGRGTPYY